MKYKLAFSKKALDEIEEWKKAGNTAIQKKLASLIAELADHPFEGTGKPEPLKHSLSGMWSRRITREHRLVYEVADDSVFILSVKGHY